MELQNSTMQIIDLSHTIYHKMPAYPGEKPSRLEQTAFLSMHGYNNHQLTTGMHIGTHIDAPLHMIEGGNSIDQIKPDQFTGRGVIIDCTKSGDGEIEDQIDERVSEGDIVLLYFSYARNFGSERYYYDYPVLDEQLYTRLAELNVKMVGMDTPSPDREPYAIHKLLLGRQILIAENLCHLDQLLAFKSFLITALPLKIMADGSPARIIATVSPDTAFLANL